MSGDVPTPQVRNGLSVRRLGGVVSTPHVIRQEESPGSSMTKSRRRSRWRSPPRRKRNIVSDGGEVSAAGSSAEISSREQC